MDGKLHRERSVLLQPRRSPAQGVTELRQGHEQGPKNKQTVQGSGARVPSAGFKHQATPCTA